jgi:hypothetical protein
VLRRSVERNVEEHHRHPCQRLALERARGDSEERRPVGDLALLELRREPPRQLGDVARRAVDFAERHRRHAAQPQLSERRRQRRAESREPRDGREVPERVVAQRLEAHARGHRLRPQRGRRRHAEPRHLHRRQPHGELREAGAVQPEGRAARDGHAPGKVVRRVAGGADDQDFSGGGETLDEVAGGPETAGGRGRCERLEHGSPS